MSLIGRNDRNVKKWHQNEHLFWHMFISYRLVARLKNALVLGHQMRWYALLYCAFSAYYAWQLVSSIVTCTTE